MNKLRIILADDHPVVHGKDAEVLMQAESRLHQSGEPVACEIDHSGPDAARKLRLRLHPVRGRHGVSALLGTLADVTDLYEARRATEAATHTAGTFLSLVSHEIRTPIAGALGIVELLAHTPLNQEQVHMLGMLEESVESLLEIMGDILDFSRLQAGELQLDQGTFDLRDLLDDVVAAAAAPAAEKGLRLHASADRRTAAKPRRQAGSYAGGWRNRHRPRQPPPGRPRLRCAPARPPRAGAATGTAARRAGWRAGRGPWGCPGGCRTRSHARRGP